MSDDLLLEAQECETEFGREFREVALSAAMVRAGSNQLPDRAYDIEAAWKPIFQLDLGSAGDALYKLFQVMPELQGTTAAYRMLGMSIRDAEDLSKKSANARPSSFMQSEGSQQ